MALVKQLQNDIVAIDLRINNSIWVRSLKSLEPKILDVVTYIIQKFELSRTEQYIELSIVLTDDQEIQQLNLQYRGKNKPTNILSFPAQEFDPNDLSVNIDKNTVILLGDLVISFDTLEKERVERGVALADYFIHLLVHGVLHLLGFDHENERDAVKMENLEIAILAHFGVDSPYNN